MYAWFLWIPITPAYLELPSGRICVHDTLIINQHNLLFCLLRIRTLTPFVVYYPSAIYLSLLAMHLHLSIHQFSSRSTDWYLSGNIPDFYQKISNLLTVAEYSVVCGVLINTVHISYYLFKLLSVTFHALNT